MDLVRGVFWAVGLLVVSFALAVYADARNARVQDQSTEIQLALERMVRLNQAMTQVTALAAVEQNTLRAASYQTLRSELQAHMQTLLTLTQGTSLATEIQGLENGQRELRETEAEALRTMRQDRWADAKRLLLGGDYTMALKLYEINSDAAIGALLIDTEREQASSAVVRNFTWLMQLMAVALLLWAVWRYTQRLKSDADEQRALRAEVSAARDQLEVLVAQRTAALEQANAQLQVLSTTDSLTGLANRRCFESHWDLEWQRALRQGTPLAVLMIDVDHFKLYNDFYGHPQGDVALQQVATVLQQEVRRAGELAARYGGEEFVVVLPGLQASEAQARAQHIAQAVAALGVVHAVSPTAAVLTLSVGVAWGVPQGNEPRQRLLSLADDALYQAKHAGRNRVALWSAPGPEIQ